MIAGKGYEISTVELKRLLNVTPTAVNFAAMALLCETLITSATQSKRLMAELLRRYDEGDRTVVLYVEMAKAVGMCLADSFARQQPRAIAAKAARDAVK